MSIVSRIRGWFHRRRKTGSGALSLTEMMAMDDEELGSRFQRYLDWRSTDSYLHAERIWMALSKLEVFLLSILYWPALVGICYFFSSFAFPDWKSGWLFPSLVLITLSVCCSDLGAQADLDPSAAFLRRRYHGDEFDNLYEDSSMRYDLLDEFMKHFNTDLNEDSSLGKYQDIISTAESMVDESTNAERGRLLKLIIPVMYMMDEGVELNENNYAILDRKTGLTAKAVSFNEEFRETERLAERRDSRIVSERLANEARKRREDAEVENVADSFVNIKTEAETMRRQLQSSSDYNRMADAGRRLEESRSTLQSKVSSKDEE